MGSYDAEYFIWEDSGRELTRELVNFKFRVHDIIPSPLREQIFEELDATVDKALTIAHNFGQLEEYSKINSLYLDFVKEKKQTMKHISKKEEKNDRFNGRYIACYIICEHYCSDN